MTDIQMAYKQNAIFQSDLSEEEKLEKLQELHKQFLVESEAYRKNHPESNNDNFMWTILVFMLVFGFMPWGKNSEPRTENEEIAFLNGKLSAYEKMLNGKIGE